MNLIDEDSKYVWHPFTQAKTAQTPLAIESGQDALLFDSKGNSFIDANSSWWTVLHGHCNKHISHAIAQQVSKLDHVIFAGVTHPSAVELAKNITLQLGNGFSKVFFSDNGSTSVEVAIKMVYQYWFNVDKPKKKILALEGAYHGDTFGAMSVGQRGYFNKPFEHLFFDVDFIPFPDEVNAEKSLEKLLAAVQTNEYAAFIFEPIVQGAAGMRIYDSYWLNKAIAICKTNHVLTIADEVMTGFYRTGTFFAIDKIENSPDIICLSKGLTGGVLPLGLTVTKENIFDAFLHDETDKALLHGHSFTGNPISCSAANASLSLLKNKDTQNQIKEIAFAHLKFIEQNKLNHQFSDLKSVGTILSMSLGVGNDYYTADRNKIYHHFLSQGILLRPLGNRIFVNPPYSITMEQLQKIYRTILSLSI